MNGIKEYLNSVMELDGSQGVAVFDLRDQVIIGSAGDLPLGDCLEGMLLLVASKAATMKCLNTEEDLVDGLFTYQSMYVIVKPVYKKAALIFAVFDRKEANLALLRLGLQRIADNL